MEFSGRQWVENYWGESEVFLPSLDRIAKPQMVVAKDCNQDGKSGLEPGHGPS
jgi:hypothetical protein